MTRSPSILPLRRPAPRRARRSGFTLIEVLGTLLLLSIVIPAAMEAVGTVQMASNMVRRRTEAAMLAESQLSELVVTGEWQEGLLSGDFPSDQFGYNEANWPKFHWEAVVDNWDQANVQILQLKVFWARANGEDSITVSTLVYVNNASNPLGGTGGATQ